MASYWFKLSLVVLTLCIVHVNARPSLGPTLSWGDNSNGLLLTGDSSMQQIPVIMANSSFGGYNLWSISAGQSHGAAANEIGELFTWGSNIYGQLGNHSISATFSWSPISVSAIGTASGGESIVQVACSQNSVLARAASGFLWSWGSNFRGILGNGTAVSVSSFTDIPVWTVVGTAHGNPTWIGCGQVFCGTLTDLNVLLTWGSNENGQLGYYSGSFTYVTIPAPVNVTGLGVRHFTTVSFGGKHALALTNDSRVMAWGDNSDSQLGVLGLLSYVYWPVFVNFSAASGDFVIQVSAGSAHSLLLTNAGLIYGWGLCQFYQLMDAPAFTNQQLPWALPLSYFWGKVTSITAYTDSSFATSDHGRFYGWGYAASYILGSNTTNNSYGPLKVNMTAVPSPDDLVYSFPSSGFATTAFAVTVPTTLPPFILAPSASPASGAEPPPFAGQWPPTPLAPSFYGGIPAHTSDAQGLALPQSAQTVILLSSLATLTVFGTW